MEELFDTAAKKCVSAITNPQFLRQIPEGKILDLHLSFLSGSSHNQASNISHSRLNSLIQKLGDLFHEIYERNLNSNSSGCLKRKKRIKTNVEKCTVVILEWYAVFRQKLQFLKSEFCEIQPSPLDEEVLQLLHIYGFEAFKFFKESIATRQNENLAKLESAPIQEENIYLRSLLSVGGGCIGEIWRVAKRQLIFRKKTKLSERQIKKARLLYFYCMNLRMTIEEKRKLKFAGMRIRDRGGLFIPNAKLLPFLFFFNKTIRDVLNDTSVKVHGRNIIQATYDHVMDEGDLVGLFYDACNKILKKERPSSEHQVFFKEWLRKMTHSLIEEFISARDLKLSETKKLPSKGSSSLRDKLFVQSSMGNDFITKRPPKKVASAKSIKKATRVKNRTTIPQFNKDPINSVPKKPKSIKKREIYKDQTKPSSASCDRNCDLDSKDLAKRPKSTEHFNEDSFCTQPNPSPTSCDNITSRSKRHVSKPKHLDDYLLN